MRDAMATARWAHPGGGPIWLRTTTDLGDTRRADAAGSAGGGGAATRITDDHCADAMFEMHDDVAGPLRWPTAERS